MAGINQGCLTCIFGVTMIYISVLFYYKFGEKISPMKIFGMILIIPCIVFLAFGSSPGDEVIEDSSSETSDETIVYTDAQKKLYAILSIVFAMLAPFFWTTKIFYLRQSEGRYGFNIFDISIDA